MNAKHECPRTAPVRPLMRRLLLSLALGLASLGVVKAGTLTIAQEPIFNASSATVFPNLMFILDASGSMGQDHTPDFLRDYSNNSPGEPSCFDNGNSTYGTGDAAGLIRGTRRNCHIGDPPFMSPDFNLSYYNPDFTYIPGWNGKVNPAVSLPVQSLANVTLDPYGAQKNTQLSTGNSGTTINLTTNYPDRQWCNTSSQSIDSAACSAGTNINGYEFPNQTYRYAPTAGGTAAAALSNGIPSAQGRYKLGAPYYWRIITTEYCSDVALKNCVDWNSPLADAVVAATSYTNNRWCAAESLTFAGCQGARDNAHRYPAKCTATACVTPGTGSDYPYPAKVRYCATPPNANTDPLTDCQGAYNAASSPARKIPKFLGYVIPSAGDFAYATITVTEAVPGHQITGITVNAGANQLTGGTVTVVAGDTPESVAARIHANLSTATWNKSVSGRTVRLESKVVGTADNTKVVAVQGPAAGSSGTAATARITVNAGSSPAADYRLGVICVGTLSSAGSKCDKTAVGDDLGARIAIATDASVDLGTAAGQAEMATAIANAINNTANGGYTATAVDEKVTITAPSIGTITTAVNIMTASTLAGYATGTLAVMSADTTTTTKTLSNIKVNGVQIGATATCASPCDLSTTAGRSKAATAIANAINTYNVPANPYTAVSNGGVVTITAKAQGPAGNGTLTVTPGVTPITVVADDLAGGKTVNLLPVTTIAFAGGANAVGTIVAIPEPFSGGSAVGSERRVEVGEFKRCSITATADCVGLGAGKFPRANTRTDCSNAGYCTYAEESVNFANWYAYYRTRLQAMKTAVGLAFAGIGDNYRVGHVNIQGGAFLGVADFAPAQKIAWYTQLFAAGPSSSTPLRSALAKVGQMYAHKGPFATNDPMQYSCQQNFALLTTDGYWNQDNCTDVNQLDNSTDIGNQDNASTLGVSNPEMWDGYSTAVGTCLGSSGGPGTVQTLADVAYYYSHTDLRTSALSNCTNGVLGAAQDLCAKNNVPRANSSEPAYQNMNTFTLGLGVSGTLRYQKDYATATNGDFYCIRTKGAGPECSAANSKWPTVSPNTQTTVDDLWHAAVNGFGRYFSAANPSLLKQNLDDALATINSSVGTGAAAATSAQALSTQKQDYAYVASYTTVDWIGNLEARQIDDETAVVSPSATWCVTDVAADLSTGATPCTGKLKGQAALDTRKIYLRDPGGGASKLKEFKWSALNMTEKGYFDPCVPTAPLTALSQCVTLPVPTRTAATGETLVNYLRGQTDFEMNSSTNVYQAYRDRKAPFGDAVGSQPTYTGAPDLVYTDAYYDAYKSAKATAAPTVYIGTNEGYLHAFDASDGTERWAYIPTPLLSRMRVLADENYSLAGQHRYFVNGSPIAADVCASTPCAAESDWRTIVVAGLAGGGRGWFALDVTDPTDPKSLWEFTNSDDGDIGYAMGIPVVTKRPDGRWVVLVTSGYNNDSGHGVLFVLDALTGTRLTRISNNSGSALNPSGLSRIQPFLAEGSKDNTSRDVYGGDLNGNVWRFRLDAGAESVVKIAQLADDGSPGKPQPISTAPITTTLADGLQTRYLIVGTGLLLQTADMSNMDKQSLYAFTETYDLQCAGDPEPIAANNCANAPQGYVTDSSGSRGSTLEVPATYATVGHCAGAKAVTPPLPALCPQGAREQLTGTTLEPDGTDSSGKALRKTSTSTIAAPRGPTVAGCYVDFPDSGERINVEPIIIAGKVVVTTNVPENLACSTGGHSFLNIFDYRTCKAERSVELGSALAVGASVVTTSTGGVVVNVTLANNPTPVTQPPFNPNITFFEGNRTGWKLLYD